MATTLQYPDANITDVCDGLFYLEGPNTGLVDQFGRDALRNWSRVSSSGAPKIAYLRRNMPKSAATEEREFS